MSNLNDLERYGFSAIEKYKKISEDRFLIEEWERNNGIEFCIYTIIDIRDGMATAFFSSSWASECEEKGGSVYGEILEQCPKDVDPSALEHANKLLQEIEHLNKKNILQMFYPRRDRFDTDRYLNQEESFGFYVAMEGMGHGVGLWDFGIEEILVPYHEFNYCYLSRDYFNDEGEEIDEHKN